MKKTLLAWIFILTITNSTAQQQQPVKDDKSKPSTPLKMLLQITKDVNICDVQQK